MAGGRGGGGSSFLVVHILCVRTTFRRSPVVHSHAGKVCATGP